MRLLRRSLILPLLISGFSLSSLAQQNLTGAQRVDLADPAQILATWTPLTGWLEAERERDGTVFRWAASQATVPSFSSRTV